MPKKSQDAFLQFLKKKRKEVSKQQILFTYVPQIGSFENLKGRIVNVNPPDYKVSVYIKVGSNWWMKPYWASPLTNILNDSNWVTDITTGGTDQNATDLVGAIVTPDYVPINYVIPSIQDSKVKAITSVKR